MRLSDIVCYAFEGAILGVKVIADLRPMSSVATDIATDVPPPAPARAAAKGIHLTDLPPDAGRRHVLRAGALGLIVTKPDK